MSQERDDIIRLITEARASGARQSKACDIISISRKTLQRWHQPDTLQAGRLDAKHDPANKLTAWERQRIIKVANLPPNKIIPKRADKGTYIASGSSFYRVLKAAEQLSHRQKAKPTRHIKKPKALTATAANPLYSGDITYLPRLIKGLFLYRYRVNVPFFMNHSRYRDIDSRKIVGWQPT